MHSNVFMGTGKLALIDWAEHKAWLETDWGAVAIQWPEDENFQSGFEELSNGDTVTVMGRVWMYRNGSSWDVESAIVLVHTCEAVKPAQRAKKANNYFEPRNKEIDDAIRFGHTYKGYWKDERDKREKLQDDLYEAQREARVAKENLEDARKRFAEALYTDIVGGDNTDEAMEATA